MNVLFVSALFPYPLISGGHVRLYQLLKHTSKKHLITLASFIRNEHETEYVTDVSFLVDIHTVFRGKAKQPKYVKNALFSKYSWLLSTYNNDRMRNKIYTLLSRKQFDVVHIEPFYVAPSLPDLTIPLVVGEHNIEYQVYDSYVDQFKMPIMKPFMRQDVQKTKMYEYEIWKRADAITVVSEKDKEYIMSKGHKHVRVVPNSVDTEIFYYQRKHEVSEPVQLMFIGNYSWYQNVDAVRYLLCDIVPKLRSGISTYKIRLIGRGLPGSVVRECKRKGIEYAGFVDDIVKEFHSSDVFIAPLRTGGGTKYKILQAMAAGCPVVTTKFGIEGLHAQHEKNVLIGDDADSLALQIQRVVKERELTKTIVRNARKTVKTYYTWDIASDNLCETWESVCKKT